MINVQAQKKVDELQKKFDLAAQPEKAAIKIELDAAKAELKELE